MEWSRAVEKRRVGVVGVIFSGVGVDLRWSWSRVGAKLEWSWSGV